MAGVCVCVLVVGLFTADSLPNSILRKFPLTNFCVMCLRIRDDDCIHLTVKKRISMHPATMFRICAYIIAVPNAAPAVSNCSPNCWN